eukprot:CAMPEP_0201478782 /NCGR_PEP_ID=MMETSP0151_2-20130828/3558_1 /ASSEMBLY_ACC=CAM_ASM_000257 /TAXON_ID=200890 /ORGANISM="Paramoeba atlantica, Strain 621/1 / CCAP 1560/9" /LENGTH=72 /DNA_ID=CAMNT_0047859981 /DNA_START=83 /DNA_END=301 /DNA_ORIENTATION=+
MSTNAAVDPAMIEKFESFLSLVKNFEGESNSFLDDQQKVALAEQMIALVERPKCVRLNSDLSAANETLNFVV